MGEPHADTPTFDTSGPAAAPSHSGPPPVPWRRLLAVPLLAVAALVVATVAWSGGDSPGTIETASASGAAGHAHDGGEGDHAHDGTTEGDHAHGSTGDTHAHDTADGDHGHDDTADGDHDHGPADDHAHDDGDGDHAHDAAAGDDHTHDPGAPGGGHHHAACTEPVTPEQQAAADRIAAETAAATAKYVDIEVALADGFTNITPEGATIVHYALWSRLEDGRVLDPQAPESLVYGFGPDGTAYFLGAMFLNEGTGAPPQPGGCLMQWHTHTNLCIAPGKGMVGVVGPDGECPPGSENVETNAMLHAWAVPVPGGPFSDPSHAELRQAVIDHYLR